MFFYYQHAIVRSWYRTWDWVNGQGIHLSMLSAFAILICSMGVAWIKVGSWRNALNDIRNAGKNFITTAVGATLVVVLLTFCFFFLDDAPNQEKLAAEELAKIKANSREIIEKQESVISNLQSKLDEKEKRRKIRTGLGRLALDGTTLLARVSTMEERDVQPDADAWESRIKNFMMENMDESYFVRLADVSSMGTRPAFVKNPGLSAAIWMMTSNLQKIIKEYD